MTEPTSFQTLRASAPTFCDKARAFGKGETGHPNYKKNSEKQARVGGRLIQPDISDCCIFCGKFCGADGKFAAYLLNTSEISEAEHFAGDDGDNLCFYPLGSDCAKKFKKLGVPVYDNETLKRA